MYLLENVKTLEKTISLIFRLSDIPIYSIAQYFQKYYKCEKDFRVNKTEYN